MAFSREVAEELGVYVYRLIDPRNGETFYVGKGTGNRVFSHASGELPHDGDPVSEKMTRIRDIRIANFEVQHVIHRHGLDHKTAFEVEGALIDAYPGLANIAAGHGNGDRGAAHVQELIERYSAEDAALTEPLLEILIPHSSSEKTVYDSTRFAWTLSVSRARKAKYVLAVKNGLIVGVYEPKEWMEATPENFPTLTSVTLPKRYGFVGTEAPPDVLEKYKRKKVPARVRGAANPIRYHGV